MARFFDEKFGKNKARYLLQCLLASFTVFIVLMILDAGTEKVVQLFLLTLRMF